jgi:hypothetical protein
MHVSRSIAMMEGGQELDSLGLGLYAGFLH